MFANNILGGAVFGDLIEEIVLSASAASVTFSNIPQSFRHLLLLMYGDSDRTANDFSNVMCQFNGDTGNNYHYNTLHALTTGLAYTNNDVQSNIFLGNFAAALSDADAVGFIQTIIPFYSLENFRKILQSQGYISSRSATATANVEDIISGTWKNTDAITSMLIGLRSTDNILANSRFSLYGID